MRSFDGVHLGIIAVLIVVTIWGYGISKRIISLDTKVDTLIKEKK